MEKLELRMYGLVPYNISPIQQAIQFGHAVVEYGQKYKNDVLYNEWADEWKTFIILNGGTTNLKTDENGLPFGTLNNHVLKLKELSVQFCTFNEPDLGDQLTAIVFILDERVFNKKKYPDFHFEDFGDIIIDDEESYICKENLKNTLYNEWVESIGGEKIVLLREFLNNFKLA